jgi:hypothetical protein
LNLDSHKEDAFWEDVKFLRESGLGDKAIAKRMNLTPGTFRRREERYEHTRTASVRPAKQG